VDGSESSRRALAYAADDARRRGAELVVVTVWDARDWMLIGSTGGPIVQPDGHEAQLRGSIGEIVRAVLGEHPGLSVRIEVVRDSAGHGLTQAAAEADLLVVGTRGRREFRSRMLGSTSLSCVLHAACPVAVVQISGPGPAGDREDART
jgi:nucleotide-binding universal stress UspA family protein